MTSFSYLNTLRQRANAEQVNFRAAQRDAHASYDGHLLWYADTTDGRSNGCQCNICDWHAANVAKLDGRAFVKALFVRNAPAGRRTNGWKRSMKIGEEIGEEITRQIGGVATVDLAPSDQRWPAAIAVALKIKW